MSRKKVHGETDLRGLLGALVNPESIVGDAFRLFVEGLPGSAVRNTLESVRLFDSGPSSSDLRCSGQRLLRCILLVRG